MRILYCAPNHAPAERLLPVNFGLRRTANSQADRKKSGVAKVERLNLRICGHAVRREQSAVHVHDLELIYLQVALNLRVE